MAIIFPPTPTPGQTFVGGNGVTYTYNNTLGVWTASGQGGTVISPATLLEARAGTLASVYSSPQTAVPKDASGMTGAAILPSGTDLQRAAISSPVAGMTRFNTDSGFGEIYTGATLGWKKLEYVAAESTTDLVYSVNTVLNDGVYLCRNLTVNAGVTLTTNGQGIVFICSGNATINGTINVNSGGPVGGQYGVAEGNTTQVSKGSPGFGQGAGGTGVQGLGKTYAPVISLTGSGGGGSLAWTTTGGYIQGAGGGAGGGSIVIRTFGNLTLSATGILTANGGNADTSSVLVGPPYGISGAAGGSGGSVILHSSGNLTVQGLISVVGGNGSNGGTSGYVGGEGGGGGGGGVVILQTQGVLTNTATIQRAGGISGTSTGAVGLGILASGTGGSFGGSGGIGASFSAPAQGLILNSGSPF